VPLPLTRSLDVFTNIPNPYNYYFFEELFARTNLRVRYDAVPAQEGRPWDLPIRSFEVVRRFGWTDVRRRRKSQVDLTIISGGYASARLLALG
jgi:hypothetical protein